VNQSLEILFFTWQRISKSLRLLSMPASHTWPTGQRQKGKFLLFRLQSVCVADSNVSPIKPCICCNLHHYDPSEDLNQFSQGTGNT